MKYSNRALWEIFYPLIVTLAVVPLIFFSPIYSYLNFEKLAEVGVSIFGVFIGFFITVLTILNSIENEYIRSLKKEGNFHLLGNYLKHAIWPSLYSIIFSVLYLFVFSGIEKDWIFYFELLFTSVVVYSIMTSFRFISVFLKLTIK